MYLNEYFLDCMQSEYRGRGWVTCAGIFSTVYEASTEFMECVEIF